jgi:hypothetical protein
MLGRLFPRQIDNSYRGHPLGLWLFGLVVLVRLAMGLKSILSARETAAGADGIPLDSFSPGAQAEVLSMFALLGLYLLPLPVMGVIALIRYRAMIPLMYLLMLGLQLASRALNMANAGAAASGGPPIGFFVNLAILGVMLLGLGLSLMNRKPREAAA